jgi:hypothetical protein
VHEHPRSVISGAPLSRNDYAPIPLARTKRPWFKFW